jgi:mannitol 2-dehydrogenase
MTIKNNAAEKQASLSLNEKNLEAISHRVTSPNYKRNELSAGIVHMSIGGFHRSHQAVYIDDLLQLSPDNWMISAVGLMDEDLENLNQLKDQDYLYSVLERSTHSDDIRVIGSIKEAIYAPNNKQKLLTQLAQESIKILSLTITEKGYCYNNSGDLDEEHPFIKHDLDNPKTPKSAIGYIVSSLAQRRANNIAPFTVMSCDNLPGNGDLTQKLVCQFASLIDESFSQWIEREVAFPNAMVDRITPKTTNDISKIIESNCGIIDRWPVVCEDYKQWVLEDKFCNHRPLFEDVGVQMVSNVEPYEKMKVRLLNGSHSALAYLSYLCGHRDVDQAMSDPLIYSFLEHYMNDDVSPCIPEVPGIDLGQYKTTLLSRFANPSIKDQIQRLAEDGSQKIPNAIVPCIVHQIKTQGSITWLSLALAGWFKYLTGVDEKLNKIEIKDPLLEKLSAAIKTGENDCLNVLSIEEVFGNTLRSNSRVIEEINKALKSINEKGTQQTLNDYLNKESTVNE